MNAVEKVARVALESDGGQWEKTGEATRDAFRAIARGLIAAFPQLALEGREEHAWIDPEGIDDRTVLTFPENATHSRTVYEAKWSEVQS